jgi:hypothetical protein
LGEKYYFVMNTESSRSDIKLTTGDPDVRAFDLGAPFLSFILDVDYRLCIIAKVK